MVRFARAEGSKGSNKRVLEEATPWSEMVGQVKKKKNHADAMNFDVTSIEAGRNESKKNKKKSDGVGIAVGNNSDNALKIEIKDVKKKKKKGQNNAKGNQVSEIVSKPQGEAGDKKNEDVKLETVLFQGVWVTKGGAGRLQKLKADLRGKGVTKEELRMILRKEQRKEEKFLRRERKRVCLRCRKRGHLVRDCPEIDIEYDAGAVLNICYVCGSTEHQAANCSQKDKGLGYPHASCYICKRKGHIARQCADNPRGLYPNGGSCRGCGSVEHLAANCPDLQAEREAAEIKVSRIDGTAVESLDTNESDALKKKKTIKTKKKAKVVNF